MSRKRPTRDDELVLDPAMGMAGDMFSAALISLGAPAELLTAVMERVARPLGRARVQAEAVSTDQGSGTRLRVELQCAEPHLHGSDARRFLESSIQEERLPPAHAEFARRALEILIAAEREAHSGGQLDVGDLHLTPVGFARTPYTETAPAQPRNTAEGEFFLEIFPELAAGLAGLEAFSHVQVLSYLHRSSGYSLTVTPPWQDGETPRRVGLFASRSPHRPSPIGLTLTEIRRIEENRIYTGPLDLFDGTPVVDIKPHLRTLDLTDTGNDGWLEGTDHLRLHKEGVPHRHAAEEAVLHEAQDILLDIMGAAKGLELLDLSPAGARCLTPVSVGGGRVRFSHGVLPVPVPAVTSILKKYRIPHVAGPVDAELLTPTGAALLAALQPHWEPRPGGPRHGTALERPGGSAQGLGLGTRELEPLNALRVRIEER